MKKCVVGKLSDIGIKTFHGLKIGFFKTAQNWPVSIAHEIIPKNVSIQYGVHEKTAEFIYVMEGKAKACLEDETFNVKRGSYLIVPPGVRHRFLTGNEDLVALSVFCPRMDFSCLDAVFCGDVLSRASLRKKTAAHKKARK